MQEANASNGMNSADGAGSNKKQGKKGWAVVTGASGGIGEALAMEFARDGYDIVLAARSLDKMNQVAASLQGAGANTQIVAVDLQDPGGARTLHDAVMSSGVRVTALVNNAGYGSLGNFLDISLEDNLGMVALNVRCLTELAYRFGQTLRAQKQGGILNVASTAAFMPGPKMAIYYASKAYVLSLTEALNSEWHRTGLHATALCPGPVLTDFQSRAKMENALLMKAAPAMSAADTAKAGYHGFKTGKSVVIPGASNFLMARTAGLAPRGMLLGTLKRLNNS